MQYLHNISNLFTNWIFLLYIKNIYNTIIYITFTNMPLKNKVASNLGENLSLLKRNNYKKGYQILTITICKFCTNR